MSRLQLRKISFVVAALVFLHSGSMAFADQNSKQAKKEFDEAKAQTDPAKLAQGVCSAAALDKKYQAECDTLRAPLLKRQEIRVKYAEDALSRKDFTTARQFASQIVPLNDDLSTRRANLLTRIDAAEKAPQAVKKPLVDQSGAYLSKFEADFEKGDFTAASADAEHITDANVKAVAARHISDIARYNSLVNQAQILEQQGELAGARSAYLQAQQISANGPGQIAEHVSSLTQRISQPPIKQPNNAGPQKSVQLAHADDHHDEVNALLAAARQAEAQQLWRQAQDKYNAALKLDSTNKDAMGGLRRVQPQMAADPAQRESILKAAIRDFYNSRFESAQTSLRIYLNEQQAANRGAADFYLGATLVEKWIFETRARKNGDTPKDALNAFKRARAEGYKPVPDYVSPALMKIWNNSGS